MLSLVPFNIYTNDQHVQINKYLELEMECEPATIRTPVLAAPGCSTAEYAYPMWERSAHAHTVNPVLNLRIYTTE